MEIRKLQYFCRVMEAGSMSRAADSLNLAQPALSKSIQALEDTLAVQLFQRSSRGAIPTEAAIRLYDHAQLVFMQLERAKVDMREAQVKPSGHVVIGMPYSIVSKVAMPLLEAVRQKLPDVNLELVEHHSHVLAARLRAGSIDLAFMASQRHLTDLSSTPLVVEEIFLLSPGAATPGSIANVSFEDAARLVYVLPSLGNGLRTAAESHFKARSLPLSVSQEVDAISLLPQCVHKGFGSTILPGGCVSQELLRQVQVRRFLDGGWHRTLVLCQAKEAAPRSAVSAVTALIRTVVQSLVRNGEWLGGRPVEA